MSKSKINAGSIFVLILAGSSLTLGQAAKDATPEKTDKLISVLKSDASQQEKADACRQLSIVGNKQAVPALAALLGDEKLSHMARYALEPIGDRSVDDALRDALGRLKGRQLVGVIGSLGVRRDAQAVKPLSKMLDHSDPVAAQAAARSLGRIGTPEAGKHLTSRLSSAPDNQRAAVADGCLACAEAFLAQGKRSQATALYAAVSRADLPQHFRVAAAQGMLQARQP